MSHDFPDGPDYNPEPIDDDPWDVPSLQPWCSVHGHMLDANRFCISCGMFIATPEATEAYLSPSDA